MLKYLVLLVFHMAQQLKLLPRCPPQRTKQDNECAVSLLLFHVLCVTFQSCPFISIPVGATYRISLADQNLEYLVGLTSSWSGCFTSVLHQGWRCGAPGSPVAIETEFG